MRLSNIARQWCYLTFLSFGLSSAGSAVVKSVPIDGTMTPLKPEKLEEPYQKDGHYAYAKSANYDRWIYSPWTKPTFNEDNGLILSDIQTGSKRAVLISEFNLDTAHLDQDKSYQILMEQDYECGNPKTDLSSKPCTLEFVIRCYGKTEQSDWGLTFEKVMKSPVDSGVGKISLEPTTVAAKSCQSGIYVAAEASLVPSLSQYVFKGLRIGFKEETSRSQ